MQQLKTIRSISHFGRVISVILQVCCAIGAVGLLLAIMICSFLPKDLFSVNVESNVELRMNLKDEIEDGSWSEFMNGLKDALPGNVTVEETDGGIAISGLSVPGMELNNRSASLALISPFVQTTLWFFFYFFLRRFFKTLQTAQFPFQSDAAKHLKGVAVMLFSLAAVPSIAAWLIQLLTGVNLNIGISFTCAFWGVIVLGLAALFEYAKSITPAPFSTPVAMPENPLEVPIIPMTQDASDKEEEKDTDNTQEPPHPDAF